MSGDVFRRPAKGIEVERAETGSSSLNEGAPGWVAAGVNGYVVRILEGGLVDMVDADRNGGAAVRRGELVGTRG